MQLFPVGSLNTNKYAHPPQNTRGGFPSNIANRKLLPTLHATSKVESVINISDLSSKESVVWCVNRITDGTKQNAWSTLTVTKNTHQLRKYTN